MQFFKSWKKSKPFRIKAILFFVVAIMLLNVLPLAKKEATATWQTEETCDKYNSLLGMLTGAQLGSTLDKCINEGCHHKASLHLVGTIFNSYYKCVPYVKEGEYTTEGPDACYTGAANPVDAIEKELKCGNLLGKCYECAKKEAASVYSSNLCKSWQKGLSKVYDSVLKDNEDMSCSTKAYVTLGVGVFALLAVI